MTIELDERFVRYTIDDIQRIIDEEGLTSDDLTYLTSLNNYATVVDLPGIEKPRLLAMSAVDVPVFSVSNAETGIYQVPGNDPIILINEERTILEYDFISLLHPMHDWDVYLWITVPWSLPETDIGLYGEWYRRDVYPDGFTKFTGESLGWEDIAHEEEGEIDDAAR